MAWLPFVGVSHALTLRGLDARAAGPQRADLTLMRGDGVTWQELGKAPRSQSEGEILAWTFALPGHGSTGAPAACCLLMCKAAWMGSLMISGVSQRESLYAVGDRWCTSRATEMCKALRQESEST